MLFILESIVYIYFRLRIQLSAKIAWQPSILVNRFMLNLRQLSNTTGDSDILSGPQRPSQISTPIFAVVGNAGEPLEYDQINIAEDEDADVNAESNLLEVSAANYTGGEIGETEEVMTLA